MALPNIVFITTDTQGREMLSAYGERRGVETTNLDRLAAEAVLFENVFVSSPVCTPSRGTWYTGLHPSRHGAWTNNTSTKRDVPMLPELLAEQAYDVVHLGKWHLDGQGRSRANFDKARWYDKPEFLDEVGREGNRFGGWNKGLDDMDYCFGHRVADRAIDFLNSRRRESAPFFLAVEFDEPHGPYICPPPFRGHYTSADIDIPSTFTALLDDKPLIQRQMAAYLAEHRVDPDAFPGHYADYHSCNRYVDYEIGRVLDALSTHENTVVIFTSDHGDHRGAFGLCPKGPTMYDHTLAVPLLIRLPDQAAGRRITGLVSSVDIFMTILDMVGIDLSRFSEARGYSGHSLLPVLHGEASTERDYVVAEYHRFGVGHEQVNGFFPIRCIRSRDWKLTINLFDTDELYDLRNDSLEAQNRIHDPTAARIRDDLHDRLLAWQRTTRDPFRGPIWACRPWRPDCETEFDGLITTGAREFADRWAFK